MKNLISAFYLAVCLIAGMTHQLAVAAPGSSVTTAAVEQTTQINVNSADAATIASVLIGIGPKKAAAIVAFRQSNGPFKSVDELTLVKGIGEKTLKENKHKIKLN